MAKIPEGYELLAGRSRDNARAALAAAEERGLDVSTVLTVRDGYLIPLGDSESGPDFAGMKVAELDEFLDQHPELEVDRSLKKDEKAAAIVAALASADDNEEE